MVINKHLKILLPIFLLIVIAITIFYFRKNIFGSSTKVTHFTTQSADTLEGYYQKSQELSKSAGQQTSTVSFLAVGDIMLSRNVAAKINGAKDINLPFSKMQDILKSTDFNFGNLESPLVNDGNAIVGGHAMVFASPSSSAQSLINNNFKILNLANNHAFDQGLLGLNSTTNFLDSLSIKHLGTGNNLTEAWAPAVIQANGISICFIGASFSSINDGGKQKNSYVARIEDLDHLKSAISNAKLSCNFVIVTIHAGTEYTRTPNTAQTTFAHAAIDDGADMIIGAHPHWAQTIERYCPRVSPPLPPGEDVAMQRATGEGAATCQNPKYIFYSLGNFIFDQEWSQETKEGLTLKITLSKTGVAQTASAADINGPRGAPAATLDDLQGGKQPAKLVSVELLPIIVENYSTPRPATPEETKKILQKIGEKESILK